MAEILPIRRNTLSNQSSYHRMCLLISTVFSGERCVTWTSCLFYYGFFLSYSILYPMSDVFFAFTTVISSQLCVHIKKWKRNNNFLKKMIKFDIMVCLDISAKNIWKNINLLCLLYTCSAQEVCLLDCFPLPLKHNDKTQGVPKESACRDQARLCIVGESRDGFHCSK